MNDAIKMNMINEWQRVAEELSIDVESDVKISLGEQTLYCPVLVKNFGHTKGMAVVERYDDVKRFKDALNDQGYGFSVLPYDSRAGFDLGTFKEILCDWGWTGPKSQVPGWYVEIDEG